MGLCAGSAACGPGTPHLQGSLGEFYALDFESTRALLTASELAIQYTNEIGERVVTITVRTNQVELDGPATVDLGEYGDVTGVSGGQTMPDFIDGELVLQAYAPQDGAQVAGTFEAKLQGTRGELSLQGSFDTPLIDQR